MTGGLLAAAISHMDGIGGKPGWAWIFILEGLITVVCGVISFWILPDFPTNAKFLTEAERQCRHNSIPLYLTTDLHRPTNRRMGRATAP